MAKDDTIGCTIAKAFQALTYWPTYLLLRLLADYKVCGQENLAGLAGHPVVFASNHTSLIDGPICAAAMPRSGAWYPRHFFPVRFLVLNKFFNWYFLLVALYVHLNGCIRIHKHTGRDLNVILREAVQALNQNEHVWIFPEGKISKNGQLQPGKRGVTYLHQQTGAPIVPVAIKGGFDILSWRTLLGRNKLTLYIGRPIHSLGPVGMYEGSARVMFEISRLLKIPPSQTCPIPLEPDAPLRTE